MMQKLWGDNYFDAKGKKWVKSDRDGTLERAFCQRAAAQRAARAAAR